MAFYLRSEPLFLYPWSQQLQGPGPPGVFTTVRDMPLPQRRLSGAIRRRLLCSNGKNEVLAGLEMSQSTLEKATNDFNTATQHGINQLRGDFANSRGETQQVLQAMNQRIDSMRRWLRSVVVLFLLSLGGLAYAIYRPVRVQDSSFRRRSRAPAMNPADDETAEWQSGESANGPRRRLDIGKDRELPHAR